MVLVYLRGCQHHVTAAASATLPQWYVESMSKRCVACHALVAEDKASVCPACGGQLTADNTAAQAQPTSAPLTVDHRGIVLPSRHAVGGVITPR